MLPVAANVPVVGSYSSALARSGRGHSASGGERFTGGVVEFGAGQWRKHLLYQSREADYMFSIDENRTMHSLRSKLFCTPSGLFCAFHDWEELMIRICCLLVLALSSCSLHWQRLPDDRCPVPLHCLQVVIGTISHRFIAVSLWEFKFASAVRSAPVWMQSSAFGALQ